ncbi:MAG: hypothetical protein ACXABY_27020 [Candidatus Thorarchaeota archaeon]|jgi:hypothetical protein
MSGSVDAAFGLRPLEKWDGSPWNGATRPFVSETSNDALYIGDAVYVVIPDAQKTCGRYMPVDQIGTAAAGTMDGVDDEIAGVIVSHEGQFAAAASLDAPELLQSHTVYVPASSSPAYLVNLVVDDTVVFTIQGDEAPTSYTDIGKNACTYAASGSTATGLSGMALDVSGIAADASHQFVVVGLLDIPGNLITDTYPLLNVLHNGMVWPYSGYAAYTGMLGL